MQYAEGYIDSAQLESSVVSRAKDLNYLPDSAKSSKANIEITFYATGQSQPYTIQKGQSFSTLVRNDAYTFTMPETVSVSSANNKFTFTTDIYEGTYITDSYVYKDGLSYQISNKNVDISSLTVAVFEDNVESPVSYSKADTLLGLTSESTVYFLQVDYSGFFELTFGDGVFSKKPKAGSTIILDYRVPSDPPGNVNGADRFVINFDPTGAVSELIQAAGYDARVNTLTSANGGTERESIESIRFLAPRWFQTQERAVLDDDYKILLKKNFPEIKGCSVFGGETIYPPRYGDVIISVMIDGLDTIPESKVSEYTKFLKKKNVGPIQPVFIDPEYTYLCISSLIRYNQNVTTNTSERMKSLVSNSVANYATKYLNDFNVTLRYFNLTKAINDSDTSIISNITDVSIYKKWFPTIGSKSSVTLNFAVGLINDRAIVGNTHSSNVKTTLWSSPFTFGGAVSYLEDDGLGNVKIVQNSGTSKTIVDTVGSIDYVSGVVTINNLLVSGYSGDSIKIYVTPKDKDVVCSKNTIIVIDNSDVSITTEILSL